MFAGLEIANQLPTWFGAPHTASEAWLGPEASSLRFDFAYGPKQYWRNIEESYEWLREHPQATVEALDKFWWGDLAKWHFSEGQNIPFSSEEYVQSYLDYLKSK